MARVGRPKAPPKPKELLKDIVPLNELFDDPELTMYNSFVDAYTNDFEEGDLTSADTDDIMCLAMNKVLEIRLLKTSKGNPDQMLNISASIEKLRKSSEKIKDNLSARRKDRIDPHKFKGFSIVDLAVAFDEDRKMSLREKVEKLNEEESKIIEERKDYVGNRYDADVKEKDEGYEEE